MPPRAPADVATIGAVSVAIMAVSTSGPLIAYAAAPALAIAFWRNALAIGVLAPVALTRRRHELAALTRGPGRRAGVYCALAGIALSGHFAAWVPATKLTSVATAVALVATQPVWQGLIAAAQGRRLPSLTWLGIAVAVLGAAVATGADLNTSTAAVWGDVLALLGGVAGAVYVALGEQVRATTSTTSYTVVCYTVCAVLLLGVCLLWRLPLAGYPATAWWAVVAITVGPQLLGHSLFNFALRRMAATTMSVLGLIEVPGAALIGWLWLGQVPRGLAWPGLGLLLVGVAVVVLAGRRAHDAAPRPLAEPEASGITL